jgi:hypothetical protein
MLCYFFINNLRCCTYLTLNIDIDEYKSLISYFRNACIKGLFNWTWRFDEWCTLSLLVCFGDSPWNAICHMWIDNRPSCVMLYFSIYRVWFVLLEREGRSGAVVKPLAFRHYSREFDPRWGDNSDRIWEQFLQLSGRCSVVLVFLLQQTLQTTDLTSLANIRPRPTFASQCHYKKV